MVAECVFSSAQMTKIFNKIFEIFNEQDFAKQLSKVGRFQENKKFDYWIG